MKSDLLGAGNMDHDRKLSMAEEDVYEDLELCYVTDAMAEGDEFLKEAIRRILFQPSVDQTIIEERQSAIRDALEHKENMQYLYEYTGKIIDREKRGLWGKFDGYPSFVISHAQSNIMEFLDGLNDIRKHRPEAIRSNAFRKFYDHLDEVLESEKRKQMTHLLKELNFSRGEEVWCSLKNTGESRAVKILADDASGMEKVVKLIRKTVKTGEFAFHIDDRDENTFKNLSDFKDEAGYDLAQILANVSDSLLGLLQSIRAEAGFLLGVVRLYEKMQGEEICYPEVSEKTAFKEMRYYPFVLEHKDAVSNSMEFSQKLLMITGANQGGKTTFLKMLGQMQLLMQAGLFLPGRYAELPVVQGVYTHFSREEDETLSKGKLAEELERFGRLLDQIKEGSMCLFNESFASTNEEEGSLISEETVRGLLDAGVRVYFVTHQYNFARSMYESVPGYFIRPGRTEEGERLYKMKEAAPEPTSYGMDIYNRIFSVNEI